MLVRKLHFPGKGSVKIKFYAFHWPRYRDYQYKSDFIYEDKSKFSFYIYLFPPGSLSFKFITLIGYYNSFNRIYIDTAFELNWSVASSFAEICVHCTNTRYTATVVGRSLNPNQKTAISALFSYTLIKFYYLMSHFSNFILAF